jgi:hypothetical protein
MNEMWECYMCCKEAVFDTLPYGYLSNYHPLCYTCANSVLHDENHKERFRLTYHKEFGDLVMVANIPVPTGTKN